MSATGKKSAGVTRWNGTVGSLTCDIDGCIRMTYYESSQRRAKSRAPKPSPRSTSEIRPTVRGSRPAGGRLRDFAATGLSVPTRGTTAEEAGSSERREIGVHCEALTKFNSTCADVRKDEGVVDQRSGQSSLARLAARRAKAWVSESGLRTGWWWSIALIVYWGKNWLKSTRYWCPTNVGPSDELCRHQQSHRWR